MKFTQLEHPYHVEIKDLPQSHRYRFEVLIYHGDVHMDTEYTMTRVTAERIALIYSTSPVRMFVHVKPEAA